MKTVRPRTESVVGLACLLLSVAIVGAQPVTIDFEGFTGMTFVSGNPVPAASQLSSQLLFSRGLNFSSESTIDFFLPGSPTTPAATDSVSIRNDLIANGAEPVTIEAFDVSGTPLGRATMIDDHPFTLNLSAPGIHSVRISEGPSTQAAAFDDFTFNSALIAVPEPSTWALLAVGVGASVVLRRSRRPNTAPEPRATAP